MSASSRRLPLAVAAALLAVVIAGCSTSSPSANPSNAPIGFGFCFFEMDSRGMDVRIYNRITVSVDWSGDKFFCSMYFAYS